ncbi:MAG: bifunctional DNA-formamidopyrimidine glycosylase/DNA-(apurinic or apyrimidinic site) lyase [Planctomycetota bacterium]
MPELPEVEALRRSLVPHITGRTVVRATLHRRDIAVMPGDPEGGFSRQRSPKPRPKRMRAADLLAEQAFVEPVRRGKQIALVTKAGQAIVVHLGMTGQLRWAAPGGRVTPGDHVHATWRLDDGSRLVFRDPRRFGGLWLLPDRSALDARWAELGPDALTANAGQIAAALCAWSGSRRAIKAALLDQGVVAGVGNIYADEALFRAGVHPETPLSGLGGRRARRIAQTVRDVITAAVAAGGSTLRDYADGDGNPGSAQRSHKVYGRAGEPCTACGATLESGQVAQRTTVWCPGCQPEPI